MLDTSIVSPSHYTNTSLLKHTTEQPYQPIHMGWMEILHYESLPSPIPLKYLAAPWHLMHEKDEKNKKHPGCFNFRVKVTEDRDCKKVTRVQFLKRECHRGRGRYTSISKPISWLSLTLILSFIFFLKPSPRDPNHNVLPLKYTYFINVHSWKQL